VEGLRKVAERGIIFEFLVRTTHLEDILKTYERIPKLKAVIEHMAKPDFTGGEERAEWQSSMKALAQHTRVACKLSLSPRVEQLSEILREPGKGWPVESIKPYVRSLMEYFGPDRLMWGSDWPVALLMSGYKETLNAMRAALGSLQRRVEEQVFRKTAMEFYGLAGQLET
jgi:L-fuconolactonase